MANKIIKYTLTGSGKIRSYISHGGSFLKANSNASPQQDLDMIGATVDGSSETGLGELANAAAIKSYLNSYASDWKDIDDDGNEIDFDIDAAVARMWAKKID